jgi:SAM-dependent methyltransferase
LDSAAPLYAALAAEEYGQDLFNPRQHECSELVEEYALHCAIHSLRAIEPLPHPAEPAPLEWLRRMVAHWGATDVAVDGRSRLRARCEELDRGVLVNLDLFDAATAIYPRVVRGEIKAEAALLGRLDLWSAYFSNRNSIYALCNRVAARCAAARLLRSGARVLEVGAGLGSATEALLELLEHGPPLADYAVTEPVPVFRGRAARALAARFPDAPLRFSALDINQDWRAQAPGETPHLVFACNVLHLARDLEATLQQARSILRAGGWLVIGECVRPFDGQPLGAELPLQLLASYRDVQGRSHGFLTPEQWLDAFARAGFSDVVITPDIRRLRALHPRFVAAAIAGRRAA